MKQGSASVLIVLAFAILAIGGLLVVLHAPATPAGDATSFSFLKAYGEGPPKPSAYYYRPYGPNCGDGILEPGEECEPQTENCAANCMWQRIYPW